MSSPDQSAPQTNQPERLEFGDMRPPDSLDADRGKLIVTSYNIRYAVGQYLISSGILRKLGFNTPRYRAAAVEHNIATAACAFLDGSLLPRVDILALQEADKGTGRTGGHHVARELAEDRKSV